MSITHRSGWLKFSSQDTYRLKYTKKVHMYLISQTIFSSNYFGLEFISWKLLRGSNAAPHSRFCCKISVKLTFFLNWFDGKRWQSTVCVEITGILSRNFGKNFVKVTVLLNELLKSWFDEIFLRWERISRFSTLYRVSDSPTLWKNKKIGLTEKKISSKQLFSNLFGKNVAFTKFLSKECETKNFVKAMVLLKKLLNSWFAEKKFIKRENFCTAVG